MKLALVDVDVESLQQTADEVSLIVGVPNVLAIPIDVANLDEVIKLKERIFEAWDEVRPIYAYYINACVLICSCVDRLRS